MSLSVRFVEDGPAFEPDETDGKQVRIRLRTADASTPSVAVIGTVDGVEISWTYTGAPGSVDAAELELLEPDAST